MSEIIVNSVKSSVLGLMCGLALSTADYFIPGGRLISPLPREATYIAIYFGISSLFSLDFDSKLNNNLLILPF